MKSDRLLSVLLLLQARGRVSERELAEELEVSQRTIHRDLEALSASRVPVVALRGSQGGWELAKGWRTQVPGLDEAELRALLMAQPRALGNSRLAAAAESALNKLMAAMPGNLQEQAIAMRERLHVDARGWRGTGEDLSMLATVQDAVARERKLTFEYTKANGESSLRTVDPLGLVAKGMSWYLVARDPKGMRTFRVSRMRAAAVQAAGFRRPARFDLASHWKKSVADFENQGKPLTVLIAATPGAARQLKEWCATRAASAGRHMLQQRFTEILEVEFESEQAARFFAMGFATGVEVLEPAPLRDWVQSEARSVAGLATTA
ncbi:MAG TPA: YafY family protein [Terracidiphilus sp.]|nr:YafY family protein [Terracidiphilus sp.]